MSAFSKSIQAIKDELAKKEEASKRKLTSFCEIQPYLYLTNYCSILDKDIKGMGITHVVDATNVPTSHRFPDVEYFEVNIDDKEHSDLQQFFDDVVAFINRSKESVSNFIVPGFQIEWPEGTSPRVIGPNFIGLIRDYFIRSIPALF